MTRLTHQIALRINHQPKAGKEANMLILTRRPGESIMTELPTGERMQIAVLGVKGNQVRIGTDAPEEITILREEIAKRQEAVSYSTGHSS